MATARRKAPLAGTDPASSTTPSGGGPRLWWQWLLLYPTLLIALFTAGPEWLKQVKAWKENLPVGQIDIAEKQHEFWFKNKECAAASIHSYSGLTGIKADADVCESGDLLISVSFPDREQNFYWIGAERWLKATSNLDSITTSQAPYKSDTRGIQFPQDSFVMCQKFLDDRNLLRIINVEGSCFDQIVDTYTGQVTSQNPSQCRESC